VGGALLALQAIVIFTHFCTLSWMYEGLMRALGKWHAPVDLDKAKTLLQQGAQLVDVRSPNEYANESVDGAINLPLEELEHHVSTFKQSICIVFCNSGTRSHIAAQKLKSHGLENIFNLGPYHRAKELAAATAFVN
jgi:rhodanese-related sulfurtransferase